jgi:hypothetical protein
MRPSVKRRWLHPTQTSVARASLPVGSEARRQGSWRAPQDGRGRLSEIR